MPSLIFNNNATTTLSGSINNTQTTISVSSSGQFPVISGGDYFYATMYEVSGSVEVNTEIIKVTAVSGTTWTIERGMDGTTARSRSGVTVYIELRWTAASARLMLQKDNNLSDLPNAATARTNLGLGTMATQSASNVAITGGTISGVSVQSIDSTTTIADNVDATKKVAFEVSGVTTGTTRTLTVPNASGTIALTSDLTSGYQPLDAELTAIAALAANGLISRTAAGAVAVRSIAVPASGLSITNPDGVSGNPTLALSDDLAAVEALATTGFVRRTAASTWSASALVDADLPTALTGKTYNGLSLTANTIGFSIAGGTTGKTLTVSNNLTLAGTDGTTITLPASSGTVALAGQTFFIGTTSVAINRASGALALTGVSIDGAAGSATSATSATTATHVAGGAANQIPVQTAAGTTSFVAAPTVTDTFLKWNGTAFAWAATATNAVTSVGVSSSDLTVTGSPITSSGTISLALNTVGITKGGTGATTKVAAFDALSPATTLGDLIYADGTDNVRLAGNITTTKRFLTQTGTGTVSAAPAWGSIVDGDLPTALTGKTYNALTLTAAATGFTIAGGTTSKTLTVSNTLTLAGTDSSTLNIGAGGTLGSAAFTASTAYAPTAGSTSIVTLGTIGTGTWQGSTIGISYGGTGATTKVAAFDALSPATTLGDLIYADGTDNVRLAGNITTTKRFLTQTGTGTVSAAPAWGSIVDGDLPSAMTGKTYNGLTLTANATGFSVAGGTTAKTLAVSNNLTLAGNDGSTLNVGAGGTLGSAAFTAASSYLPTAGGTLTGAINSATYLDFRTNNVPQFLVMNTDNAVNQLRATGSATGTNVKLQAYGTDTNVGMTLQSKGTGSFLFNNDVGATAMLVAPVASAVNYVQVTGAAAAAGPNISVNGSDANIRMNLTAKGTGDFVLWAAGAAALNVWNPASAVNYITMNGQTTGYAPVISAAGSDANIDLSLLPKGTGVVKVTGKMQATEFVGNLTGTASNVADGSVTPAKLTQPLTFGAFKSATGTAINFSSIPTWVRRITIIFSEVSTSGTSVPIVQIGESGVPQDYSYESSAYANFASFTSTTGFICGGSSASQKISGVMTIVKVGFSGFYVASMSGKVSTAAGATLVSGGQKGVVNNNYLDCIRITTSNGTDTFDSGIVNIMYE